MGDREPPRRPRPRLGVLLRLPCPLGPGPVCLIYLSTWYMYLALPRGIHLQHPPQRQAKRTRSLRSHLRVTASMPAPALVVDVGSGMADELIDVTNMTPPALRNRDAACSVATTPTRPCPQTPPLPCPQSRHVRRTIVVARRTPQPKTPARPPSRPPQTRTRMYRSVSMENVAPSVL